MSKNSRKRARSNDDHYNVKSDKLQLITKVSELWGRTVNIKRSKTTRESRPGTFVDLCNVSISFADFPEVILELKGIGSSFHAAEENAAFNFISFFENGFIAKESVKQLRSKWVGADLAIQEIMTVCRVFDQFLKTDEFSTIRDSKTASFLNSGDAKIEARQLKTRVRSALFRKDASDYTSKYLPGVSAPGTSKASKSHKEPVALDPRNPMSSIDEEVIVLDDDDDDDVQLLDDSTSSSSAAHNGWPIFNPTEVYGGHDKLDGWIGQHCLPVDYERKLFGVTYCGNPSIEQAVAEYTKKYRRPMKSLDEDIWRHYKINGQSDQIFSWKMEVREKLLREFIKCLPDKCVRMYAVGSTINGCGSYNSDMDLCLCISEAYDPDNYDIDRNMAVKLLRKINSQMMGRALLRKLVKQSNVIPAKVPIVKVVLHPPYEALDLDININNIAGIYNSHLIHYYSRVDARFPALTLLIKHWAIKNDISDAMTGTFNSYSLVLLVLHYLQCGVRPAVLPNLQYLFPHHFADMPPLDQLTLHQDLQGLPDAPKNVQTLAELLVGFFHYYDRFDFDHNAISIRNGTIFKRSNIPANYNAQFMLMIEEPFDGKNTARCITKAPCMRLIKQAIKQGFSAFSTQAPNLANISVTV